MKEKFTITIFWSDEDNAYIGVAEELKGCSAWGGTYEDALREVRQAMDLWLEIPTFTSKGLEKQYTPSRENGFKAYPGASILSYLQRTSLTGG
jgi:predicted RNase H-like HicB family nuclease